MASRKHNDKGFITISNKMIYDKICRVEKMVEEIDSKTVVNRWISTTALSLSILIIGIIINMVK